MTTNPLSKSVRTLASGPEVACVQIEVESLVVDPWYDGPHDEAVSAIAGGLAQARLDAPWFAVPGPQARSHAQRWDWGARCDVELVSHRALLIARKLAEAGVTPEALWHDRRRDAPTPLPMPLAASALLRTKSASLGRDELLVNANHFLFHLQELDTPFDAYGDPIGLVAADGEILAPPQVPRACLVRRGGSYAIAPLGFSDVRVVLPDGTELSSHPFGAPREDTRGPMAFARYFGNHDGHTPAAPDAEEAVVVGRHVVAFARGGAMAIPRGGCVLRFPGGLNAALRARLGAGEPVSYRLQGPPLEAGIQAGPRLVSDGALTLDPGAFEAEGVFVPGAPGDLGQPSPYKWMADLDTTRAARLGAGIRADGSLFLLAAEGGSSYGEGEGRGATLRDIAHLLAETGAVTGMHLDGGGSTQMFRRLGGALLKPGDIDHALADGLADYDRPLPLALRVALKA